MRNRRSAAFHRQDDVGPRCHDRLVRHGLVAGRSFNGIDRSGQLDDAVGRCVAACRENLAALCREHEQDTFALFDRGRLLFRRGQFRVRFDGKRLGLGVDTQCLADKPNLFQDALMGKMIRHFDIGHARFFQHVDRFTRAAALDRQDARRVDRQDTLGRQLAHITDIGKL